MSVYNVKSSEGMKIICNFFDSDRRPIAEHKESLETKKIAFSENLGLIGDVPCIRLAFNSRVLAPDYAPESEAEVFSGYTITTGFTFDDEIEDFSEYEAYLYFDEDADELEAGFGDGFQVYNGYTLNSAGYGALGDMGIVLKHKVTGDVIESHYGTIDMLDEDSTGGNTTNPINLALQGRPNYYGVIDMRAVLEVKNIDKLFISKTGAVTYARTGEEIDPLDPEEDEDLAEDREVMLYYESDIFKRNYNASTSQHIGVSAIHFRVQYKNNKGEEIVNPYRAICGYVATNNEPNDVNKMGNIVWIANNNINLIETKQNYTDGTSRVSKTIPSYANTSGFYPPYIDGNTIYDARYNTNMRVFANQADAIDFLNGGNPTPVGEGTSPFNPSGFIGDKTVFNDGHDMRGGGMSSCWIMNETQLESLANVFTTGLTTVEEQGGDTIINITKTCARAFASHGEPIDAVVDLFWLPFDPIEFVVSGSSSFQIGRDDLASATSLIKLLTTSGDTVIAHGNRSIGTSHEFVGNVVDSIGDMFENTTQKVRNVSE